MLSILNQRLHRPYLVRERFVEATVVDLLVAVVNLAEGVAYHIDQGVALGEGCAGLLDEGLCCSDAAAGRRLIQAA